MCRFGSPFELANETHFRTYKEARIMTRGDRDIIIKRSTEENLHFLKTFRCNHDIQVVTDPWASAEYLFSYVAKNAQMEKNLVYQMSNCTCSSLIEAKSLLLKTGNAVLSHRQIGKVEASWTILGIPLYHSSIRCKTLYISLPWEEERILKRGRTIVTTTDDFVESLTDRYVKRPHTPSVIDQLTLFEFLTWFDFDRSSSLNSEHMLEQSLLENPLWHTTFDQSPLLKTSNYLPRIILSCGTILIQHKEPACISFTCRYDDSMLAIYSILSIGVSYRDPIEQFLNGKQEVDIKAIHQILLKYKAQLLNQFSTLPGAYKVQMINALEHLCDLNSHDFLIKPRTSFIFTTEDEENIEDETNNNTEEINQTNLDNYTTDASKTFLPEKITSEDKAYMYLNNDIEMNAKSSKTEQLLKTANIQQQFLVKFFRQYLLALMIYEQNQIQQKNMSKPLPFHIIVNGLAGSGKSYVIAIIEQMLSDFCISESAVRNRPLLLFGDLAQCEPVAAKQIFWAPTGETFSLWSDLFRPINFNINMRQGEDRTFFDILCQMRLGEYNEDDEIQIKNRSIRREDNPEYYKQRLSELQSIEFENSIYTYSVRSKTYQRNSIKLKEIAMKLKTPIWIIQSIDKIGMVRSSFFNPIKASNKECKIVLKPSQDENECGSMFEQLPICIGARVICRRNIDFDGSMVNGTEATVNDIVWDNIDTIILPMSNQCVFPNLDQAITTALPKYIELKLVDESIYKMLPEEVSFKDKNGIYMTRRQFPLNLGYAITVHRSQCMTYNKLAVDLTGTNWKPGMFYTILSRTRKLSDIIILAYDRKSFKVSKPALTEMNRLQKIEQEYPIKIEQYLGTKRYIDWCLPQLSNIDKLSLVPSNQVHTCNLDRDHIKRLKCEKSNLSISSFLKMPEDIIICEYQEQNYCGRHALRALSQNLELFSDDYLINIAQNIAQPKRLTVNQHD
ncbi:unnamed protein product [Rotaria socialis]|uniref:ubiquitinyl hydrolase 1 n=2 Tax=Rotaria socialis TaxID=392032 RepID=A0A820XPH1_9BILA|nr:unnamed protein product [Rotaria socialis]CAF4877809.1 unnamed protein product [Rotaria socialis]